MTTMEKLAEIVNDLPANFYGTVTIGFQNRELSVVEVLAEPLSFIIRKTLLRILRENLLPHFADAPAYEAYFGAAGLTNAALRQKRP